MVSFHRRSLVKHATKIEKFIAEDRAGLPFSSRLLFPWHEFTKAHEDFNKLYDVCSIVVL